MRTDLDALQARAKALNLNGLLVHWQEAATGGWVPALLDWEEQERARRSLERRLAEAHIGRFKPLSDFDWASPTQCDRGGNRGLDVARVSQERSNVVFVATNGLGKTMIAQNIAYQAVLDGYSVRFTTAGHMLGDLAALGSDSALRSRLRYYARPRLLVIDEVGCLSYSNRHADLLFELVSRRYEQSSTLITTNRPFAEWHEVSPTPPASSPSSIASSTMPTSSDWRASPTDTRRRKNALQRAPPSVAGPSHDRAHVAIPLHRQYPRLLDAGTGARHRRVH
jgi:DNA replication protein DnaC